MLSRVKGFTLVELVITIAVFAILAALAVPSFIDLRERMALRGSADQFVSFWANAKLEALKRDQFITVDARRSGTDMCIGATTVSTGCNCFTAGACDVGQFPAAGEQSDWRGVTMTSMPTLGAPDTDDIGLATIDPKRGYLTTSSDVGGLTLQSREDHYRLRLYVDQRARAYLCQPTNSPRPLSDYSDRTCAP